VKVLNLNNKLTITVNFGNLLIKLVALLILLVFLVNTTLYSFLWYSLLVIVSIQVFSVLNRKKIVIDKEQMQLNFGRKKVQLDDIEKIKLQNILGSDTAAVSRIALILKNGKKITLYTSDLLSSESKKLYSLLKKEMPLSIKFDESFG